jgi:glycosyltransferase involved in cell wall biosynthesis
MKEMRQKLTELTIFFPCYNEEENLPNLMDKVLKVIPEVADKYEVLIVNDGSKDKTSAIAHDYANKYSFVRVIDQKNQGFGGALNAGLQNAKYSWVFYTDADLQFDLNDIYKFVDEASEGDSDVVIGYRIKRAEGFKRAFFAKGMKVWNQVMLGFPMFIKDIDCAFKLIKKDVIVSVGPLNSKGNLVSSEFLLKAIKRDYKFAQIGVNHYNRAAGVSTCGGLKDIVKVLRETFALRELMFNDTKSKGQVGIGFGVRFAHK